VVELVRKLVLSSVLLLFDQGSPWQIAGAALFSVASHLLYTNCRPMKDPRAHVLHHIGLGLTTLNCESRHHNACPSDFVCPDFIGLMLKVEAIKDSAFAGPLLILVNLSMALALICAVLYGGAKMEASVARDDSTKKLAKELELTQRSGDDSRGWSVFEDVNTEVRKATPGDPLYVGSMRSGFTAAGIQSDSGAGFHSADQDKIRGKSVHADCPSLMSSSNPMFTASARTLTDSGRELQEGNEPPTIQ
jgi:hypothetical protein